MLKILKKLHKLTNMDFLEFIMYLWDSQKQSMRLLRVSFKELLTNRIFKTEENLQTQSFLMIL